MSIDRIVIAALIPLLGWAMMIPEQSTGAAQDIANDKVAKYWLEQQGVVLPAPALTHTDQLIALMSGRCIEWDDPHSERRMMTCGDTVPAMKIVSYEAK